MISLHPHDVIYRDDFIYEYDPLQDNPSQGKIYLY